MLHELDQPTLVEVVEKSSDIGVQNVVHLLLQERVRQRIQRLVLAAPRAKPIGSSRPAEVHRHPLTDLSVSLSPHSAPIRQTHQPSRSANVQRYPRIPSPAVVGTDSLGSCGV